MERNSSTSLWAERWSSVTPTQAPNPRSICEYRVLTHRLAVCRATAESPIPAWAQNADFFCIVHTTDELSLVCPETCLGAGGSNFRIERGWIALKLQGPFPFSVSGILASFLQPLAEAEIPIFAVSTFDTDYVLIKQDDLPRAQAALKAVGHELAG
jgi:hypothetical protein